MVNHDMERIVLLAAVAERKRKDAILTALLGAGIHLISTVYGRGAVSASYLTNMLGLVHESSKAVIICVTTESKADGALNMLAERFDFNAPNTGIAFTVPVEGLLF